ncbi:MAG TPA: M13 family metallopeptidase [Croceicoccus sp.]|nr:M13 family metallopeptidase [Croceicoccus sp.]
MKRIILAAGCSALTLALATPTFAQDAAPTAAVAAPAPTIVDPAPMTWPVMGFDPADVDPAVKPGDDFHAFVNGKWEVANPIPPQFRAYGVTTDLSLKAEKQVAQIITEMGTAHAAKGTLQQKVGDTYNSFLNREAIDAKGMAPAQAILGELNAIQTQEQLARFFGKPGMPDPFGLYVGADDMHPSVNQVFFSIGGLGLPDRDNYLVDSEKNLEIRAKYKDYLTFLLGKAGYEDPRRAAEAVYALERRIAVLDWDRAVARNPQLIYNELTRSELTGMPSQFPMQAYLDALGLGAKDTFQVIEMRPDAAEAKKLGLSDADMAKLGSGFPALVKLVGDTDLATWKAWSAAQFLNSYASVLPKDIEDAQFAFWGQFMGGQQVQRPRDKRAISLVNSRLGEAVGQLYVERNFSPEAKAAMFDLVANLRTAMGHSINSLAWMDPATKQQALDKLSKFTVKIGYPDKWETYEGLEVSPDDALGNSIAATAWSWQQDLDDLTKPVDKLKWYMPPQTVNAYYNASNNEIVFPAAYLQAPNFALTADPAVNYGIIGTTIGHEISHGFDDQGSQYDGDGVMRNWWKAEDRAKFEAAARKLINQYDAFCPLDDGKTCINGKLTLGENIADLAGLKIAYDAYKLSLNGKEAPVINGLTGDQRFFIAHAIGNRGMWTEQLTRTILQTDPHSPDKARTNVPLANFDPWYKAFDVKPGDKLYIKPEDRVRMW